MSNLDRLRGLCQTARTWIKPGFPMLEAEDQEQRLAVCATCDQLRDSGQATPLAITCAKCNCPLATKTWFKESFCEKWPGTGRWYFDSPDNVKRLRAELESWRGTRFAPAVGGQAKKGVACDCVSFVAGVLQSLCALPAFDWPAYVTRGGGEGMLDLILKTMNGMAKLNRIHAVARPGDILVISSGKALHHLAIYSGDNTVWHATERDRGVSTCNLYDPTIVRHTVAVYRVLA